MRKTPRVVVAGLRGGSGKTTLSVGLAAALRFRGLGVAPFKKGPDYIDAGWLGAAAATECYNLDSFMAGSARRSFAFHSQQADIAVIEGNRGLFDGMDAEGTFSTSNLARELKAPVILIVDATKRTRTSAAVVLGARKLDRGLNLAGVVLNRVGGQRHERVTREAVEKYAGVPVVGAIPRLSEAELPERHMGLTPWQEHSSVEETIAMVSSLIEKYVDIEHVLRLARKAPALKMPRSRPASFGRLRKPLGRDATIGVIRDSAFQFYYPECFEELQRHGASVKEVSALTAEALPDVDALYIGGGFPETHVVELAKNKPFMKSLRAAIKTGLPVYAECGGLMYLGKSIELNGRRHRMSGVLPARFVMHEKPFGHGYTEVGVCGDTPFFKEGALIRGHEFHYSEIVNPEELMGHKDIRFAFQMKRGKGIIENLEGITYKNVLATYTHTHALGSPEWVKGMLRAAQEYRATKK